MSKFWNFLVGWADALGRARAAAELSRQGQHRAAKDLIKGTHG